MRASIRGGFTLTLVTSMALGPMVLFSLAALGPVIVSEFRLSRTQFGALSSGAFFVAMSVSVASGRFVDKLGGRRALFVLSAVSGISMLLVASGSSYASLVVAVAFSGFAISLGNPVTNHLISLYSPIGRRGIIVGVKQSGVPLSQLLVGIVAPLVALAVNWRLAVGVLCVLPVLNMLLSFLYVPSKPPRPPVDDGNAPCRATLPVDVWWLMAYSLLMGASVQATNTYLPLFGHEQLGFEVAAAGLSITVAGAVGLVARVAWGGYSDRLHAPHVLLVLLALGASCGPFSLLMVYYTDWRPFFWMGVVLHGGAAIAATAVAAVALVRTVDSPSIGRASGILALGQFAGFSIGPLAFGYLVDLRSSYIAAWVCAALLYGAAAGTALMWMRRRPHPSRV